MRGLQEVIVPQTGTNETLVIDSASGVPLVGLIHIGIIDRGSNLLQVRTSTACNMSCTFCSTDGGPYSRFHRKNVVVEPSYLAAWLRKVIAWKECNNIEVNLDSVGEPTAYPFLEEFLQRVQTIPEVKFVSMQTNATLLTPEKVKVLEAAGLKRLNVSIHALDGELAKYLFGNHQYNAERVRALVRFMKDQTKIEVNLTPVYLPGVNDKEIPRLIAFAKELRCRISIQKYEFYKYSRKDAEAERLSWFHFYQQLEAWEKEFGVKLKVGPRDFQIVRMKKIPLVFQKGDMVHVEVKAPGWFPNEMIGVAKDRAITIMDAKMQMGDRLRVKITHTENSIYLAKKC